MPAPAPPEVVDAALLAVATGATQAQAARIAGVGQPVVSRWVKRLEDRLQGLTTRLRYRATRKVLSGIDGMLSAQMQAASNPEARHGPQSMRVCLEAAGTIGGIRDVTINGDVDARSVSIDARRVAIVQGKDLDAIRAESKRLADELGLNA